MSNPLLVGVDVHRQTNTVCLMDLAGQVLGRRRTIDNNRPGATLLVDHLAQQMQAGDFDTIQIAAEATGWYWWHFFQTLSRDPTLQQWPLQLYPLNPRLTANFAKSYVDRDHTDQSDAFVIADRLRMGHDLPPPYQLDARYLAVRLLTRYRFHLVHAQAREKAYALSILYLKASEYGRLKPFGNLFGAASRAVLQEFASLEESRPCRLTNWSNGWMCAANAALPTHTTMRAACSRWRVIPIACPIRFANPSIRP